MSGATVWASACVRAVTWSVCRSVSVWRRSASCRADSMPQATASGAGGIRSQELPLSRVRMSATGTPIRFGSSVPPPASAVHHWRSNGSRSAFGKSPCGSRRSSRWSASR